MPRRRRHGIATGPDGHVHLSPAYLDALHAIARQLIADPMLPLGHKMHKARHLMHHGLIKTRETGSTGAWPFYVTQLGLTHITDARILAAYKLRGPCGEE